MPSSNQDSLQQINLKVLLEPNRQPISVDDLNDLLTSITGAYDRAQSWTKEYEVTFNALPIACINQMRNAGYHMCRFIKDSELTSTTPLINLDELRSAYKHLLRAYYDVLDEFTKKINEMLKETEGNYRTLLLNPSEYFNDFYEWKDTLNKLESFNIEEQDQVLEIAITTNKREQHYVRITEHINRLKYINSQITHMANHLITESKRIAKEEGESLRAEERAVKADKRAEEAEKRAIANEERAIQAENRAKYQLKINIRSWIISTIALITTIFLFLFGNDIYTKHLKEIINPISTPTESHGKP